MGLLETQGGPAALLRDVAVWIAGTSGIGAGVFLDGAVPRV